MRPILFSVLGFDVQTYGVSKVLAAWVAALLLARAFERGGLNRDQAYSMVLWVTVWGFAGAKVYYLLEQLPTLTMHDFGGMGFTWYGGFLAATVAALVMIRKWDLPLGFVAGALAVPLSVAYAIGRLGCLVAGDGTFGRPTTLPWGMTFPNGVVSTDVPVHPTPLYEAAGALLIAGILWWLGRRRNGPVVFAWYLVLSGVARFLVEFLRTNDVTVLGLTQPQLWALVGVAVGVALAVRVGGRQTKRPVGDQRSVTPEGVPGPHIRQDSGVA
ncbi:prolipoprotein diacylglyceryl transferase [Intrasporangium calvum]|uniref:Phosphatidylglycerol--prolipoprotein diacylglyceryl transferase n=1 Tax=Intrasporangium calvum TaxID=53358 RepID=A0ABT5GIF0_9MICO|nr:prolipoprotein diacylglyceryl transferase [Intrasporangium calvum]MDC5697972.1 prolipoprotein diacylglyceryl transferase [Intrasporangium calvum]